MAGTVSKLRLVARCAVISIPKDVREAAGWDIGQQVVCEAVKLERGDVRVVISEASEEEMRTAPQAGRGSHTAPVRKVTADTPLFDLAAQHRAKNTGTKRTKSGKVSFARRAQVHDGGERRVKAPRVRMQGERRASTPHDPTKRTKGGTPARPKPWKRAARVAIRKGQAAAKKATKRHTAKPSRRLTPAQNLKRMKARRANKGRAVKRTVKRARA